MRAGVVLSVGLHVVVLTVLIFGLPSLIEPPTDTIIPIEMVLLEEVEPEPEPEPEPKPEPVVEEPPPKPEPPKEVAKAEPEPEPPAPEPEPAPLPEPEAKPEPKKEEAKPLPPKPRRRPEVKVAKPKKQKKKEPDRLASILKDVEKMRDKPQPRREQLANVDAPGARSVTSRLERDRMIQAIQEQLVQCWRVDAGAKRAEDLLVEIRVTLNSDGSVRTAEIVDTIRMFQDSYFRSAAEGARRAVLTCSPFQLPPNKYKVWRQLTLRFNPREMLGT
jgi:hypothetical protein